MTDARNRLTDETIDAIRDAYAAGAEKVTAIRSRFQVSGSTLDYWIDGGPAKGPRSRPPLPRRSARHAPPVRRAGPGEDEETTRRLMLVSRLWRASINQVKQIERRIADKGLEPVERERDNRMLSVATRTLRELIAIDETKPSRKGAPAEAEPDDDEVMPRDLDELRRELARRVERILRERDDAGTAGDV